MMRYNVLTAALVFTAMCLPQPGSAQTNGEMASRIDRLQRDIMTLQRQVSRGEPVTGGNDYAPLEDAPSGPASANLEVRLSAIEEQMRKLRGQIEETQHQIRSVSDNFEKFRKDTDFRLNEMSQAQPQPAAQAPAEKETAKEAKEAEKPAAKATSEKTDKDKAEKVDKSKEEKAETEKKSDKADKADKSDKDKSSSEEKIDDESFDNPKDLYNHAFRLMNQTRYDDAASSFQTFTKKYPKDPLIGNAYYWIGETQYIRRNYVKAADNFRQGFEAMPSGKKAPDNLLKLGMSLAAMDQTKDACVVLKQITVKFKAPDQQTVLKRAESERTRLNCQ